MAVCVIWWHPDQERQGLPAANVRDHVQELMLAANMAVAALLADAFPDIALLRRHPPPLERKMAELGALSEKLGLELDVSGAAALQASLQVSGVHVRVRAQGLLPVEPWLSWAR